MKGSGKVPKYDILCLCVVQTGRGLPMNLAAGVGVTAAVVMMTVLGFLAKPREDGGGSVSDLVKRGQLRSDRGEYVPISIRYLLNLSQSVLSQPITI